jgi:hypothetical protein
MAGNGNDPMDIPEGAESPYGGTPDNDFTGGMAHTAGPNAYGPVEQLPGITSGAAPKPWGLNRDQPTYNQLPAYGPGGRGVRHYTDELARIRPMDTTSDPGMTIGDDKMPGTRSRTPVIMQERPNWKYRET